ncbi:MAG: hypothetical protein L0229_08675 [Blastocatellia bacterium]|nr:hypothetical protein [Blastocatellia bacterium]
MKFCILLLAALMVTVSVACRQKPAYSDMELGPSPGNDQSNANQAAPPSNANANAPGAAAQNSNSQSARSKLPSFMDERTGEIKDLPSYPGSYRTNAQYGPDRGINRAFVALQTSDSVDRIAAFYNDAIKSNGWTVVNTLHEPELYKIEFKKGDNDQGSVQAQKNPLASTVDIVLSRIERPTATGN